MTKEKRTARDYPRLDAWLRKHNGRRLWRAPVADRWIEAWQVHGGRGVLVEIHGEHGWDLWTNMDSIDAAATLADAERRLGLS